MAMSDNAYAPAYAHVTATGQSKALKQKMAEQKIPEQIELLALSSDSCSTYPPERTSPSALSAVLSPTNNGSVFNYGPVANQQRRYQPMRQVHLHNNPQYQAKVPTQNPQQPPPGTVPVHVAQLSPPNTLHQNHMTAQLQAAAHQQRTFQQQQIKQPVFQQLSPTTSESEIIKALSHALVGQHQVQAQQQQQINFLQQQQQQASSRQQTLQMQNNELLKRRLSRWEKLTNQNRNYLLSLNNKEDQFRAICALSLLAVPEPQF